MSILIKILGILIVLAGLFYFLVFSSWRLFGLQKISGADVGPYKNGQVVLSKSIMYQNNKVNKGDVIIFDRPVYVDQNGFSIDNQTIGGIYGHDQESVAQIVGLPGEIVQGPSFYYDNVPYIDKVPDGVYLVKVNNQQFTRALPAIKVKYVVWRGL